MSAKHAATFGAAFGGAWGGVPAAGLAQYLIGDNRYLPLIVGAFSGGVIASLSTAAVTSNNLDEPTPNHSPDDRDSS